VDVVALPFKKAGESEVNIELIKKPSDNFKKAMENGPFIDDLALYIYMLNNFFGNRPGNP
jgi:hypothetical protein